MRHRLGIAASTGLGNSDPEKLDCSWSYDEHLNEVATDMMKEAVDIFFKEYGWCDFSIVENEKEYVILMGIEPSYKFDELTVIAISSRLGNSFKETGIAWGFYGTRIASRVKLFSDYKYKTKFTEFARKWSPFLEEIRRVVSGEGNTLKNL